MKDYKEIADKIVEAVVHFRKGMRDTNIHLDIAHSTTECFAKEVIEYEFAKLKVDSVNELGNLADKLAELHKSM